MLRALLAIVAVLRSAWVIELVGAGLIVWGVYEQWGTAAALIAGGSALVLKAFELDAEAP
jgi:hypothetical protein